MKVAYADPPYPGMSHLYKDHPDYAGEVDHAVLITRLCDEFPDGWALSTASTTLRYVLTLCPDDVRVSAWVKTFASFKPGVNPAYAWEPVIWRGGRKKRSRSEPTVRDWIACPITLQRGLTGAKPDLFCCWLFDLLGLQQGDQFDDLFPGSGAVTRAFDAWMNRTNETEAAPDLPLFTWNEVA